MHELASISTVPSSANGRGAGWAEGPAEVSDEAQDDRHVLEPGHRYRLIGQAGDQEGIVGAPREFDHDRGGRDVDISADVCQGPL